MNEHKFKCKITLKNYNLIAFEKPRLKTTRLSQSKQLKFVAIGWSRYEVGETRFSQLSTKTSRYGEGLV